MNVKKIRYDRWEYRGYSITLSNQRIKGLYPKYSVSRGWREGFHVSTLKEAKEVIDYREMRA